MKHQYFGDIHDYRKYGLLRVLQQHGDLQLLVAWMLTADDGGSDGQKRRYLEQPGRWWGHDPELFAGIQELLSEGTPSTALLETSGLLPRTRFFSESVPDARMDRSTWQAQLLAAAEGLDWVFLDPDNGIEIASKPVGRKHSSKYVLWRELEGLWGAGHSLLVYQHYPRRSRVGFVQQKAAELRARLGADNVAAITTEGVVFFLVAQKRHWQEFSQGLAGVRLRWAGKMEYRCFGDSPVHDSEDP